MRGMSLSVTGLVKSLRWRDLRPCLRNVTMMPCCVLLVSNIVLFL